MTRDISSPLALEAYRAQHAQRTWLFASTFIGLGLFGIAYATWPADQNKDLAEPMGVAMTGISLLLILADTQLSIKIERAAKWVADLDSQETTGKRLSDLHGPALRVEAILFGVLAVLWSYLASVGAGGAPLWGMIISGSLALLLLLHAAWRINKAQSP